MLHTRDQLQANVADNVQLSTSGAVHNLSVLVDEAEIRISGSASTYYVKQLATQAALSASDGRAVRNDIHVKSH